jgi:hypothetical protein
MTYYSTLHRHQLEGEAFSVLDRNELSARLDAVQKAVFAEKKRLAADGIEEALQNARKASGCISVAFGSMCSMHYSVC